MKINRGIGVIILILGFWISMSPLALSEERTATGPYGKLGGTYGLPSTVGLDKGDFSLHMGSRYFQESDFIFDGDDADRYIQTMSLAYGLSRSLELTLDFHYSASRNDGTFPSLIQDFKGPNPTLKYHRPLGQNWHAAAFMKGILLREVGEGAEPSLKAFSALSGLALRRRPFRLWGLPVQPEAALAFLYDQSEEIFNSAPSSQALFAYDAAEDSSITAGVSFLVPQWKRVHPFLGIESRYYLGNGRDTPLILSPGMKIELLEQGRLALSTAVVLGVLGRDDVAGRPRVPLWEGQLGLSLTWGAPGNAPGRRDSDEIINRFGRAQGKIVDPKTGEPIARAKLTLKGQYELSLSTDAEGRFLSPPLESGIVAIRVEKDGYKPFQFAAELKPGQVQDLSKQVTLEREAVLATLKGTIRSQEGKPVKTRLQIKGQNFEKVIEAAGSFELSLPEGSYAITLSAPGHLTQEKTIELKSQGEYILNITLYRPLQ